MWLADAVAAYVEKLSEREFDAPFIALLHHLEYTHLGFTHGSYEFGKDFVARSVEGGVETQWCFQTKAGDIKKSQWRTEVAPQVHAMRTGSVVHPNFDKDLPRRIVVVTTGRLAGSASIEFQEDAAYYRKRGEVPAELWDVDKLVPDLEQTLIAERDSREQARILEMVGRLRSGRGTRKAIEQLASAWLAPRTSEKDRWGDVLVGCLVVTEAQAAGREDLALQACWQLLRAGWRARERGESVDDQLFHVAHTAFDAVATNLWRAVGERGVRDSTTTSLAGVDSFVTHPIKAARLAETLAMLTLYRRSVDDGDGATAVGDYLAEVVKNLPALATPVGEEWAYSTLVTAIALAVTGRPEVAADLVRRTAVWVLDWIEVGSSLAPVGASPDGVVEGLLAAPYRPPRPLGTPQSYLFTVLMDLAVLLEEDKLAEDLVADMEAFRIVPTLIIPSGVETGRMVARVDFSTRPPYAAHHSESPVCGVLSASGEHFDALAIWATFRDRHDVAVLKGLSAR